MIIFLSISTNKVISKLIGPIYPSFLWDIIFFGIDTINCIFSWFSGYSLSKDFSIIFKSIWIFSKDSIFWICDSCKYVWIFRVCEKGSCEYG